MKQNPKQDLRFIKNENLIRETFYQMLGEMDYSKISIKELTQRAQINRKTFYLHYTSLDHLLATLQLEIMEPTFKMIEETRLFPMTQNSLSGKVLRSWPLWIPQTSLSFPVKVIFRRRKVLRI